MWKDWKIPRRENALGSALRKAGLMNGGTCVKATEEYPRVQY